MKKKTRLYRIWTNMVTRCTNPNFPAYRNYGGRGVGIFPEWRKSFAAFARDVGEPPTSTHSIDRWPNRDGNYEPGNVRWATREEQGRNRRGHDNARSGEASTTGAPRSRNARRSTRAASGEVLASPTSGRRPTYSTTEGLNEAEEQVRSDRRERANP